MGENNADGGNQPPTPNLQPPADENSSHARRLLEDANLQVTFGQRVALVGPNGSGKTTLFKAILNHADWQVPELDVQEGPFRIRGYLRRGKSANIGDYSQIHSQALDESATLIQWFINVSGLEFQPASEMLHRFLFKRPDLDRTIGTLSGGEKSRLQLARLVHERVNFLMLDEPTNHLDIQACEQLEDMLEEFEGTLLVISHDRYFLDRLVNTVVELKDRKLEVFDGSFNKWWQQKHTSAENRSPKHSAKPNLASKRTALRGNRGLQLHSQKDAEELAKQQRAAEARESREEKKARQRQQHRHKKQLKQLETKIETLEKQQKELEKQLAQAFQTGGAQEAHDLNTQFQNLQTEITSAYQQWEELAAAME